MSFRKIIKIVLCLLVLLFTFLLGDFNGWVRREALIQKSGVYVYDTAQRLNDYSKMMEQSILDENLPPDRREHAIDEFTRRLRPLVVAGPVAVFIDTDSGDCLVSEVREGRFGLDLLRLQESHNQSRLSFFSRIEKGWEVSRLGSEICYFQDGVYEKGGFFIHSENGKLLRAYLDSKGTGVFDEMVVCENGILNTYHLNGLSWVKVDDEEPDQNEEQ